ncbi:MAG: hypothetical protein PUC06_06405 [Oscillospiraceae bacterium]|nr:hypothetical protein [Oscillospiraceae bacterium]
MIKKLGWVQYPVALISGVACTVLMIGTNSKVSFLLTTVLSAILLTVLLLKTCFLGVLLEKRTRLEYFFTALISLTSVYAGKSTFYATCGGWCLKVLGRLGLPDILARVAPWAVAAAALPMMFLYVGWFVHFMWGFGKKFWADSDYVDRMFLFAAGMLFAMLIGFTYACTQAFYGARLNGYWYNFDLVYSADSGYLVHTDVYRMVGASENDLRQPLYGLFAMPFCQLAWIASKILFFLPNGYVILSQIVQMLLYLTAVVMLGRIMKLEGMVKALYFAFHCVTYPVLIFVLTAEQYLMAVFYLIMMLYLEKDPVGKRVGFIAATGSLLTTGALFPAVTGDRKFSKFFLDSLKLCLCFFAVVILCGKLTVFLDFGQRLADYKVYSGADVAPLSKLMQFVNFVGACLVAPASHIDFDTYSHVSWQMLPVTDWNPLGILFICGAILGVLCKPRERFSWICAGWMAFSLLLLGIVGWGTIDNGLMLYTLYFGWAYTTMVFQLVVQIFDRVPAVKILVLGLLILVLTLVNINALKEVILFGTEFFPAIGG